MPDPESVAELLALEPDGEDRFVVRLSGFGGDTMGCAARAAALSCSERALHAFHCSFLRPVLPDQPLSLRVARLRDGRRLSQRRLQLFDGERLLYEARASFSVPTEGLAYQDASAPKVPEPESLPTDEEIALREAWTDWRPGPLTFRRIGPSPFEVGQGAAGADCWLRPRQPIPEDPSLHVGALTLATDWFSHFGVVRRTGLPLMPQHFASLDHAVWVHRPIAWDDWWLFVTTSEIAVGGRALSRREIFTRDGALVASVAQEALVTPPAPAD
jgi:acyl-CoA thioesterase-2